MGTVDDCFDKLKTQVGPFLLHAQGFIQDFLLGGGESIGASMKHGNVRGGVVLSYKVQLGLGESPSLPPPPPPPQKFVEDLASLDKFDKFNAYAHQGCI